MSSKHTGAHSKVVSGADQDFYLPAVVTPSTRPGRIEWLLSNLIQYEF